jgi:hypothetical protein
MEHYHHELPIRSKIDLAEEIGQILHCLHTGQRDAADRLIENLKNRSLYLDETIQGDVLMFAEAVQFQEAYDPWHRITPEIQQVADKLIEDLGFVPPSP